MTEHLPDALLRAFKKPEYAESFVFEGVFRLGRLQIYREIEDKKRTDATEGHGYYKDKNGVHEHFEFGGHIYLLSLSTIGVDNDFLKNKMGESIVRINSVVELMSDIDEYLSSCNYATFGGIKGHRIQYNKGDVISGELDQMDRAILSVTQKPKGFSPESEYRLFVIFNSLKCSKLLDDYIEINLGKRLSYAELVA